MKRTKLKGKEVNTAAELSRLLNGKQVGAGEFMALCPAHDDHNPSLSIGQGSKQSILLFCQTRRCPYPDILKGLERRGISIGGNRKFKKGSGPPDGISLEWYGKKYVARYPYRNESGEIIGYEVRYESYTGEKDIIPYFKKEDGGKWKSGYAKELKDKHPLYNLNWIQEAPDDEQIWVVEGAKCTDAFDEMGLLATTSPGGSGAAGKADWAPLAGRKIIIWPDNDVPGKAYAASVLRMLFETGDSAPDIQIVDIDQLDLNEKGDVVDWLEKGNSEKDILSLPRLPAADLSDIVIQVDQGENWKAMDQAEKLLLRVDPYAVFQRCGTLVRIEKFTQKKMLNDEENIGLNQVTEAYLTDLYNRKLTFVQLIKNDFKAIDPPAKIANRYLKRSGHWKLKSLAGLIYAPTMRPDGTVLESPGYDKASGVYYDNGATKFAPLKKDPGREDALNALKRLQHPLRDFPFVSGEDKSVVLAAILTALIRQSIPTAPLFGFSAPVAGSGKTLLANVVSIIATGRQAVVSPQGNDKVEEKKHLFAKLLEGKPILLIDNCERPLDSDVLSTILTAPGATYSDRILGESKSVEVPTNVTFMATGNNLSFRGDMTRRALLCTIDTGVENPETRNDFGIKKLENYVLDRREQYVKWGLTILKAYVDAGKPEQDILPYGGFEDWSGWPRSALVWVGCADPNITKRKIEMDDPVKIILGRIITLWEEIWGLDRPVKVQEIVHHCNKALENKDTESKEYELAHAFLEAAVRGSGKQLDGSAVGTWLHHNKDKIQDGYKITKSPYSSKSRIEWVLKKV